MGKKTEAIISQGYIGTIFGQWKRKWNLLHLGLYWGNIGIMEKKMEPAIF